jgi:hypothetical protein
MAIANLIVKKDEQTTQNRARAAIEDQGYEIEE